MEILVLWDLDLQSKSRLILLRIFRKMKSSSILLGIAWEALSQEQH